MNLTCMLLDCWKKPEHPEQTNTDNFWTVACDMHSPHKKNPNRLPGNNPGPSRMYGDNATRHAASYCVQLG